MGNDESILFYCVSCTVKHRVCICFWVKLEQWTHRCWHCSSWVAWSFVRKIEEKFLNYLGELDCKWSQGFLLTSRFYNYTELLISKLRPKYTKLGLFQQVVSFWDYTAEHWLRKASKEKAEYIYWIIGHQADKHVYN